VVASGINTVELLDAAGELGARASGLVVASGVSRNTQACERVMAIRGDTLAAYRQMMSAARQASWHAARL
jgi:hypothetical protein